MMPLVNGKTAMLPDWCELQDYAIVTLPAGSDHTFPAHGRKQKLIVASGSCQIGYNGQTVFAHKGANLDLATDMGQFRVTAVLEETILVFMTGDWDDETGGSGLFRVVKSDAPHDRGDPVPYAKETNFDSHYHDCDEYWILFKGCGVAVSEGQHYAVGPGDCIVTGMGHHHDFPQVSEPVEAVYFETTLQGEKRRGHLWEHTHGPAHPQPKRI
jgi:mannose-6-phosphate isomerase-like protein (cupin superfamily)